MDHLEEIKNHLDIVETVSEHVILKKSGRNYWGCCPFHKEKTPSFSVNPEKGIYKCFGCGAGGDAISFLMKVNNSTFWETIVALAQKFGIELPEAGVTNANAEAKKKLLETNKKEAEKYKKLLLESPEAVHAREYLKKRAITKEIIEMFNLGYAPSNSDNLFKNRIMIPIQDEKGNFIAFGARAMNDNQGPKYLNSSESIVFNKSRSLYAIFQAKDAIKAQDSVILMEGYFDVISAHVHGLTNVVATLGTALTEQHIKVISRYSESRRIHLAFDSDEAGVNATNRGAEIIKSTFSGLGEIRQFDESFGKSDKTACEIRVVTTNSSKDPDEFLREHGAEAYKHLIETAPLLIDYQIGRIINSNHQNITPQDKAKLVKEIIPLLAQINNSIIQKEYIGIVANKIGIDSEALGVEVQKSLQNVTNSGIRTKGLAIKRKESKYLLAEKNLLSLYFINDEKFAPLCINNYIKVVEISDPALRDIKTSIDEIVRDFNDSHKLFQELLTKFVDNEEVKNILTDLVYSIDDKKDMSFEALDQYIKDHIAYLSTYPVSQQKEELRAAYHADNKNEMSSQVHQKRVKELITERRV